MPFKNLTGENLVKQVKERNFRELKNQLDEEVVEKVTNRISEKKKEIIANIRAKVG